MRWHKANSWCSVDMQGHKPACCQLAGSPQASFFSPADNAAMAAFDPERLGHCNPSLSECVRGTLPAGGQPFRLCIQKALLQDTGKA